MFIGSNRSFAAVKSSNLISPYMDYIAYASCDLYINSSGVATVKASVNGYQGITTKATINVKLQKYVNGSWTTCKTYSTSSDTYRTSLSETYNVSKGYSYRVEATIKAYQDTLSETQTITSSEAYY